MENEVITKVNEVTEVQEANSIPNGYFKYGDCEVCSSSLILPLCPGDDHYSKLVWAIYMNKTREAPKLCYDCRKAYDEVLGTKDPKIKRDVRSKNTPVVKVSDYLKAIQLGIIDREDHLVI